jgi:hypothetical protein
MYYFTKNCWVVHPPGVKRDPRSLDTIVRIPGVPNSQRRPFKRSLASIRIETTFESFDCE